LSYSTGWRVAAQWIGSHSKGWGGTALRMGSYSTLNGELQHTGW
jgi:hypothetical protein